jgi:cytosine/adenosine deaminase-related metal-dependent hydrolase
MASADVPLVWSPASNLALYGRTADVLTAMEEGVTVALAPDWTVTGSDNLLEEMKVAWEYSQQSLEGRITARDLFAMATVNAAKVAGVDGFLGRLEPRHGADLFLAQKLDDDPFASLLKTHPRHVELVFVDGRPLYGDATRLQALVPEGTADVIEVDGAEKAIVMVGDLAKAPRADEHYSDVREVLEAHMTALAPLIEE